MKTHVARFVAGADTPARIPDLHLPEVAFAGRSNVGKSSLLNRLVGHLRLARVSKTPGRTQQINFFVVDESLVFADLPGYGFARVPLPVKEQWKHLVESYLASRPTLRAVIILVDIRRGLQADDALLLDLLASRRIPAIVVATKVDKLNRSERQRQQHALVDQAGRAGVGEIVITSAHTGEGVDVVGRFIATACASRSPGRLDP